MTHAKSESEVAFTGLLARLANAAATITGPKGAFDALERAEGFRFITRVLSGSLDMHLERADPARPDVTRMLTPTRKFLGDNPDTDYDYIPLDGASSYRIVGTRTNVTYIGFCLYGRRDPYGIEVTGNLSDEDIVFEDDGSFEILLGPTRPEGAKNFLELTPSTYAMLVREYFLDRTTETRAPFVLTPVTACPPPEPLCERALARHLEDVGRYVEETVDLSATLSVFASLNPVEDEGKHAHAEVAGGLVRHDAIANAQAIAAELDPSVILGHMPTPDIQYAGAFFALEDDEAVLVEGIAPAARYWSVQVFNRWLESPDYRHHTVAMNSAKTKLDADGRFRIVVSAKDPGVPNWMSTVGHRYGQIAMRALLCPDPLEVTFRRVALSDLGGAL